MDVLELHRVLSSAGVGEPVPVGGSEAAELVLRVGDGGEVRLEAPGKGYGGPGRTSAAAMILLREESGAPMAFAVPLARGLRLNGIEPLGLRAFRPGDVLSFRGVDLLLVRRFRPEPGPVPAHLGSKPCPVCGAPLEKAPICACSCGSRMHLEAPDEGPRAAGALNCFLSISACKKCGRATGLEERLIPEPGALGF